MQGFWMFIDMMLIGFVAFGVVRNVIGEGRLGRRLASIGFVGGAILYGYFLSWVGWADKSLLDIVIWYGPIVIIVLLAVVWIKYFRE